MIKHQETHPALDQKDCFGCHIASVYVGAVPGGTRPLSAYKTSARQLARDVEAYGRAKKAGLQPDTCTVKGVEKTEKRLESEDRAFKKLGTTRKEWEASG